MAYQWTNENVLTLIHMYKDREILWNMSLDEYKNRDKKDEAWLEIASAIKVDPTVIQKKIKTLITQFQREIKKARYDSGHNIISNWVFFKNLLFLKKRIKETNKTSHVINSRRIAIEKNKMEIKKRTAARILLLKNKKKTEKGTTLKLKQKNIVAALKSNTQRKKVKPQPQESKAPEKNRTLSIVQQMHESRQERDEFDVFGEHVAIKLRQLISSCANHTAQYHINNILFNAAMGEYDMPSNRSIRETPSNISRSYNRPGRPRSDSPAVSQSSMITQGPSVLHPNVDDGTSTECPDDLLDEDEIKEEVYLE